LNYPEIAFQNVFILALLAIPGFIAVKAKVLREESASKVLAAMLLYICQPFVTIDAFLNTPFRAQVLKNLALVIGFTFLHMLIMLLIAKAVFYRKKESEKYGAYNFACVFGNIGYMCVPFLQMLTDYNSEIILYASGSMISFNIMAWSYGSYLFTKNKKDISIKRILLNPPTVTFLLLLPFFILNLNFISLPALYPLKKVSELFSILTAPLSMTILGAKFAAMDLKEVFNDINVIKVAGIKNLLSPLLGFALIALLGILIDTQGARLNMIALSAMPVATNVMMFSEMNNGERKTPAKLVALSTLLSILTIPLALLLFY
jgi:predicted permease